MIGMDLVLRATSGRLLERAGAALLATAVRTDSRAVQPGDLFVALRGERFDGHDFVEQARASGAVAALVSREVRGTPLPQVVVADTLKALGDLARTWRERFSIPVIAVTGSNGKTTTKDMCAAILGELGPVLATAGNLNNEIGLPLTLLGLAEHHRFAVLEAAMRGPGEIAALGAIAQPDVAVITNVAAAHLGRLGSLEAIARAKGELFSALRPGGRAVYPSDEPLLEAEAARLGAEARWRFGATPGDAVRIERAEPDGAGTLVRLRVGDESVDMRLPLPGSHNVRNAAAAAAAALAVGARPAAIAAGLSRVRTAPHRSRIEDIAGRVIFDDCYNANPQSMAAALRAAAGLRAGARLVAVLGDMRELGDDAPALHAELGRAAAAAGVAALIGVGPLSRQTVTAAGASGVPRVWHVEDAQRAADRVGAEARPGDVILVKASRAMELERVIDALRALWSGSRGEG